MWATYPLNGVYRLRAHDKSISLIRHALLLSCHVVVRDFSKRLLTFVNVCLFPPACDEVCFDTSSEATQSETYLNSNWV